MATPLSQRQLRNDSGAIMRRVQQGERFTVTRNGVPVADLIPHSEVEAGRPPRFVPVAEIASGTSELPSGDSARFARELDELDNVVDDSDADSVALHQVSALHERALLDTSVVIDFPADAVAAHASTAAVSTITLAELASGLHTADPLLNAAREERYHWITRTSIRSRLIPPLRGSTGRYAPRLSRW